MGDHLQELERYLRTLADAGEHLSVQDCGCVDIGRVIMRLSNQRGGTVPAADLLTDIATLRAYTVFKPVGIGRAPLAVLDSAMVRTHDLPGRH